MKIPTYDDREELIDAANFIRSYYKNIKVKIEWFVFFNKDGSFKSVNQHVYQGNTTRYRHPDLSLFLNGKFLCCLEIDGSIHDIHVQNTTDRNTEYKNAGVDLIVVNKEGIKILGLNKEEYIIQEIDKRLNLPESNKMI